MGESKVNNGVNVQALLDAREALKDAPQAAKFNWRASCKWVKGTYSKSTIHGFHGLGARPAAAETTGIRRPPRFAATCPRPPVHS